MRAIKFLGASGMVTGSCYRLTSSSGQEILLDFGMFQGAEAESAWNYTPLQFDPGNLVGAILTHAHLDHCGRLPMLSAKGFRGQIFMTPPTRDLAEISLYDTARIASENSHPALFAEGDVRKILSGVRTVSYHQEFSIGDFRVTFFDAGHLLGSASVQIVDLSAEGAYRKIVFSGDLGNSPQLIVKSTEILSEADLVVMESTYGDKIHPSEDPLAILESEITAVEKTGGTLLVPTFSLERSQDILNLIGQLVKSERVSSRVPFFLDSPMAIKANEIYRHYPDYFNKEALEQSQREDLFSFPNLVVVEDHRYSNKIKQIRGVKVIIAGSGMMTGGRILSHAKQFLPQKNTRLLMVGYQGVETLGREIQEGAKNVQIDGQSVRVRATISSTESLSSHADQPRLLKWLANIKGVKKVFLTHGEELSRQVLAEKIYSQLGIEHVFLPQMNEEVFFS